MKPKTPRRVLESVVFAAGACFVGLMSRTDIAMAQALTTGPAVTGGETEEVIVQSPYILRRGPAPRGIAPPGLTNPELITLSRRVSYRDLDLSTPSGVAVLEARIKS